MGRIPIADEKLAQIWIKDARLGIRREQQNAENAAIKR